MRPERRAEDRFEEIGRVDAAGICALPGVVADISGSGCRVRFPVPVSLDMEKDYVLTLRLPHGSLRAPLELVARPVWLGAHGGGSVLGFSFLQSQDSPRLVAFIQSLVRDSQDEEGLLGLIVDCRPHFVTC